MSVEECDCLEALRHSFCPLVVVQGTLVLDISPRNIGAKACRQVLTAVQEVFNLHVSTQNMAASALSQRGRYLSEDATASVRVIPGQLQHVSKLSLWDNESIHHIPSPTTKLLQPPNIVFHLAILFTMR